MAKKAENKPKEQTTVPEAVESMQETPVAEPENMQETPAAEREAAEPESMDIVSDILNNEAESEDGIQELEEKFNESPVNGDQPPEEKILFYIRTVNARTAIRSTPEHPMRGNNIVGTINDRELHGITEVADGFGRLEGGSGWVRLDSGVVTRQG